MKNTIKFFALFAVVLGFAVSSYGQESASADASATIVTPIAISSDVDMNFGNVTVQSDLGGTVVLPATAAAVRTFTGGITLPAVQGTVSAAHFNVTGQENYLYAITIPTTDVTIEDDGNTMIVNAFTCSNPLINNVLTASADNFYIGATLNVALAQPAGTYTLADGVEVTVVYE
jgi:hypothetical protein